MFQPDEVGQLPALFEQWPDDEHREGERHGDDRGDTHDQAQYPAVESAALSVAPIGQVERVDRDREGPRTAS